jgi:2-polyprenyl-6-methoxyphenol hydroxylase-like FAD-dependent oxidoreductase
MYITYNIPGGQVGRFTLHGDRTMFVLIFRAAHSSGGLSPKAQLRNHFGDAGWECPGILAGLDSIDDLYFDVVSQIRMDHWSRGRVLLIGDAAGCISLLGGEGTGIAIAESYVLAGELNRVQDHRLAFDAYESRLHPFVTAKQAGATRLISFFATRSRIGLRLRNIAMRIMNAGPVARLLAGSVRDDIVLPDYQI